jgi:type IV pilus assembly protein PilC
MAKFKYLATDIHGKRIRGVQDAASVRGAMALLVDQQLDVQELTEKKSVLQFEITRKKLKQADLMHFCRQLAAFVRAGIPLVEALGVIEEEADDKTLRQVLQTVQESLISGDTFSAALQPFETMFPQFFIDMVRAAELTGRLDDVLDEMSRYIRRDMEARAKIKSAITYPIIILFASVATVVVLAVFVLPRFKTFFESFNATLPLPTRMLISVTNFFGHRWFVIIGVLVLIATLLMALSRTERGRKIKDRTLLRLPVLGEVIRYAIVERFCRLLSTMMGAGVPLPEAMAVLGQGTRNVLFQEGLADVRDAMMRGEGLARPMSQTELFPSAVVQMVRVGENTGTLDQQLEVGSDYYGQELDYKITRLTAMFEPAVILFMGFAVGFVALALISAMYGIYRQVQV